MSSPCEFTVVSTFSGCGGSSLGYEMAGGEVRLAVEWDDHAAETYRLNFPDTPLYHGDVGGLDVLDGSPPCQGFSTSGKRLVEDPRNRMFAEFVRLLGGLKPRAFVMENVYGMVKGKMKVVFAEILRELRAAPPGYRVSARLVDARFLGVPQRRQRLIFVGVREDLAFACGLDPVHPAPMPFAGTVREALAGLPDEPGRTLEGLPYEIWRDLPPGRSFKDLHPKGHWFSAHKVHPDQAAPTVTATIWKTGQGGLFHWEHPRPLTIPELKRVHTFPDGFEIPGPFQKSWARIGNSVPPNMMREIAGAVRDRILCPDRGGSAGARVPL